MSRYAKLGLAILVLLGVFLAGVGIGMDENHRDLCRGLNGKFVDGGKYGDDACFGPDGRLVKVW